jgi:hypothetical protein
MNEPNYKELYEKIVIENQELKEHLKKYTAPKRSKSYYENNKDEINEKNKEYHKKIPSEKIKEYSKRAYEKKKGLEPKCNSCNLFPYKQSESKLCCYCDPNSKIKYASKELKVVSFLKDNKIEFIHNKSVGFECGNYRPDILIDCNTHFIVIEIDENQHEGYDKNCEMARMNNIFIALGLPVVFLRYNPDKVYHKDEQKKIGSNNRMEYLFERFRYYQEYRNYESIIIEKIFYNIDDDNFTNSKIVDFEFNL